MSNIVIPFRAGNDMWRQKSSQYVFRHMEKYDPVFADDGADPFSRSGSRNAGASKCPDDVIMFLDADTYIHHDQIDAAIELAREGYMVHPFTHYHFFNAFATKVIYRTNVIDYTRSEWNIDYATGGAIALPREMFFDYGGYDENFVDWGYEDAAFIVVRQRAGHEVKRIDGNCAHLWHPRPENWKAIQENEKRYTEKYLNSLI